MKQPEPYPAFAPPPPVPPIRQAPPGCGEPSPEPTPPASRRVVKDWTPPDLLSQMRFELSHVTWPTRSEVDAGTAATIGLLAFLTFYIFALDGIAGALLRALGF